MYICVAAKGKGGELPVDNRLLATGDDNVPAAQERGLPSPVCFPLLRRSRFFSSALSFLSSAPFRLCTGPENPRGGTAYIKIKARPIKVARNTPLSLSLSFSMTRFSAEQGNFTGETRKVGGIFSRRSNDISGSTIFSTPR